MSGSVQLDVRCYTVGPVQENCYIVRLAGSDSALIVDPGEESPRLLGAIDELGVKIEGILITHTHFDHIGAVADVASATEAPVWCPAGEAFVLANPVGFIPPGIRPFEGYEAEHKVAGGDRIQLAGLDIDVISTPGHSPDHVTYSIVGNKAIFSGDVLFQGSVGRTDLPGADWGTLQTSIENLLRTLPDETVVYPGHMGATTLGRERGANPFLQGINL